MFRTIILQILFLFSLLNYSILESTNPSIYHWDYQRDGPDTWSHKFDTCEGEFQSPIDIRLSHVKYDPNLTPLSLNGYTTNTSLFIWNFTHDGRTIIAYPPLLAHLSISGANLLEPFYLVQFYFHWGYNPYQGSEHTIDGIKFPLEIHFLHQARSGAFAILSILFNLQHDDNSYINDLLTILNQTTNSSISIEHHVNISRLFPTSSSPRFYLYNGSLTFPPCTEGITWIILARTIPISSYQLEVFAGNSVPFNYRHPQKLYSRKILANFQPQSYESSYDEEDTSGHHSSACVQEISIFLLLLILIVFLIE